MMVRDKRTMIMLVSDKRTMIMLFSDERNMIMMFRNERNMIKKFSPTKIACFPTKCRFPHMCRFPQKMQISPVTVPYTIFPTRYVRIARSTFGMGGADLGAGAKVAAKLKCLLCHWADDLHRFSPFFRPPFQSHPLQTATARAGSRARSVTDAAVGCRAL